MPNKKGAFAREIVARRFNRRWGCQCLSARLPIGRRKITGLDAPPQRQRLRRGFNRNFFLQNFATKFKLCEGR